MECVEQVAGVAGEAIGRRHHHHVARIERADRALELGPLGRRTADLLADDFGAAGGLKLGELLGQVLAVGRDTRLAVNHGAILHQIFASGKGADCKRSR
jgi:hypothetical protein